MAESSLTTDQIVQLLPAVLLLAHLGVLVWYVWFGRRIGPVLALNLLVSGGIVAFWLPQLGVLLNYVASVQAFVAFELGVFLTTLAAIFTERVPRAVTWLVFAAHTVLITGALYFIMTFKLTRLF